MSWKAQYEQNGTWHDMNFNSINVLEQPNGQINASGTDEVGQFTFQGHFNNADSGCKIVKQYLGQHAIYYEGVLNKFAGEINGHWGFNPGSNDGGFRMKKF